MITVAPHPLLESSAFLTQFPAGLEGMPTPASVTALFTSSASAPFASGDAVRKAVRDLLRYGGYKPTGRGKPASEYLLGAVAEGPLASINLAVDVCNAVSLHSGLPISVIDLDRARAPFSIQIAPEGQNYVFNASGQTIDVSGLVCLFDADGPCANAVKDAQRTKTQPGTTRTLTVIWGTSALSGRTAAVAEWYRGLLALAGASTSEG